MSMELTGAEKSALDLIQKDRAYENYFFSKTSKLKFFHPLKDRGYFTATRNPGPVEAEKGSFSIPEWNVLPYLERLSKQIRPGQNEAYIDELLSIIKAVSKDADRKDNYRTWWYFTKILVNLSNNWISNEVLELIPLWLDSRFDNTLPASEVAQHLLPKFLTGDPEDVKKAALILNALTYVKWSPLPEKLRGLGESEQAQLAATPHWLIETFSKAGTREQLGQGLPTSSVVSIADRLLEVTLRRRGESVSEVSGKNLSLKVSGQGRLTFTVTAVGVAPLFNVEIPGPITLAEAIKALEEGAAKTGFKLDPEWLAALPDLYEGLYEDYSYIWIKVVAPGRVTDDSRVEVVLAGLLTTLAHSKATTDRAAGRELVRLFLSDKYRPTIFRRLAISLMSSFWSDFREEFWKVVETDALDLFEGLSFEPEVYRLLESNIGSFTQPEKEKLQTILDRGPRDAAKLDSNQLLYWRQKWFSAVKMDADFSTQYDAVRKKTGVAEEISFKTATVRTGPGPSPLSRDELIRLPNKELVELLKTFKTVDHWRGPTLGGLTEILKGAVQMAPEKFVPELPLFKDVPLNHIYNVLRGFEDAWKEKRSFDWQLVLDFLIEYVDREAFWNDSLEHPERDHWKVTHEWVVGQIGRLIQAGTSEDSSAFAPEAIPSAVRLLVLLASRLKPDEDLGESDPVLRALNSSVGKVLAAILETSLRCARLAKGVEPLWRQELKTAYSQNVDARIPEALTVFGQYLPNFRYLDKPWADELIKKLESTEERLWRHFFIGYLYGHRVYTDIYNLMRGHYALAMSRISEREMSKQLVDHIGVGYLRGLEVPESGLLQTLLDGNDPERIRGLLSFFWMQRDFVRTGTPEAKKMRAEILKFNEHLYTMLVKKGSLDDRDKQIAALLPRLLVYEESLEKRHVDRIVSHLAYLDRHFEAAYLIENLDRLKDKGDPVATAPLVGEMLGEIVNQFHPDYDKAHIRSIVAYLLKHEVTRKKGRDICNEYAMKGLTFLDDLYASQT